MAEILVSEHLSKFFGGLAAVNDVSFAVGEGEVLGLIGPNGAGKTTTINLISGFLPPSRGKLHFRGEDITGMPTHLTATRGLVRTFQVDAFFQQLTVFDHLFLACLQAERPSAARLFFGTSGGRKKEREAKRRAKTILELMHLVPYENSRPRGLPHGYQRWLSLGMALALKPAMLLLDEPFSGMNAGEVDDTLALLKRVKDARGLSILLVEHNVRAVMNFCDRIVVLQYGQKICEGTPAAVSCDPRVIEAYLGGEDGAAA